MGPHIRKISERCNITLVAKDLSLVKENYFNSEITLNEININRRFSPISDLKSLYNLFIFFKNQNFKCVHSITPKGGLLGMLAAAFLGVELRIHTFTGQMWLYKKGISRQFYIFIDRLIAKLATHIIIDSHSQLDFLIKKKIVDPKKAVVFGSGSIVGVDVKRFVKNDRIRREVRENLNIRLQDIVFLYIGRLNKEKGITELLSAFNIFLDKCDDVHLLIVGPDEESYDSQISALASKYPRQVHRVGLTSTPEIYMASSDVLVLPSYREGFGNVVIEAASVGLPAIVSNVYGLADSIVDGKTGFLHNVGAVHEMVFFINLLYQEPSLRLKMGLAAKNRAINYFSQEILTSEFEKFYKKINVY